MDWYEFKEYLSLVTELDQDALHVYAAVLLHLMAAGLMRKSLASIVPWLVVLAVLGLNEWGDLREPGRPIEQWQVVAGLKDIWNTMTIPTVLLVLGRYFPWLLTDRTVYPESEASPSRR